MIARKIWLSLFFVLFSILIAHCQEEEFVDSAEIPCEFITENFEDLDLVYADDCNIQINVSAGPKIVREFTPVMGDNPNAASYDYIFVVREGTSPNILFNYMGGGACWDGTNCLDAKTNMVYSDISLVENAPQLLFAMQRGIIDFNHPSNPFKDWTLIYLPYTTGDIHWGSNNQDYVNEEGETVTVYHRGFDNFLAALRYTKDRFPPETIKNIFVTGQSAGAYGAVLSFPYIKEVYKKAKIDVLGDAGSGVITDDFLQSALVNWKFTDNLPTWIPGISPEDFVNMDLPEVYLAVANYYTDSYIAHYTSRYDHNQIFMYYLMLELENMEKWVNLNYDGYGVPDSVTCDWTSKMMDLWSITDLSPNLQIYVGPSRRHTITTFDEFYTLSTNSVKILDWVNQMLIDDPSWSSVYCDDCDPPVNAESYPNPVSCP